VGKVGARISNIGVKNSQMSIEWLLFGILLSNIGLMILLVILGVGIIKAIEKLK